MPRKGTKNIPKRYGRKRPHSQPPNRWEFEKSKSFTSTSAQKILQSGKLRSYELSVDSVYCFLNFALVFNFLSDNILCKECNGRIAFSMRDRRGIGFKLNLKCECGEKTVASCPLIGKGYEVNRRIVFVFRLLGLGINGLSRFCGMMDICSGMSTTIYYACVENIQIATKSVYDMVLKKAVAEEKKENVSRGLQEDHFIVSGDGTWKKRGFSSLIGVSSLIAYHTKKVVDAIVKSKFCQACSFWEKKKDEDPTGYDVWQETHVETCTANHDGSSGKMETDGITEMFVRSVELHGVKYVTYVGDGDSKTFKGVLEANPYDDVTVQKKECVGHVEKRMGTRLRNMKKGTKGLGGKGAGKLTDKAIGELTKYYGLAIRRNSHSVQAMKDAIWATYYHKSSTDKKPQHEKCPPGENSWCTWRKAEASDTLSLYKHKAPLSDTVLKAIEPIYKDLSSDDLLQRCLGAHTQNSNESLNNMIWMRAPKQFHSGADIVNIATELGVIIFNEGEESLLIVMDLMGVRIGTFAESWVHSRDKTRIERAERQVTDAAKKARIEQREMLAAQHEQLQEEEGCLYGAGIAD